MAAARKSARTKVRKAESKVKSKVQAVKKFGQGAHVAGQDRGEGKGQGP